MADPSPEPSPSARTGTAKLLRSLVAEATPSTGDGAELSCRRAAWDRARAHVLAEGPGPRTARALAELTDQLLGRLLDDAVEQARAEAGGASAAIPGVALLALGGYGRRELLAGSDVDVCLLVAERGAPAIETIAQAVFTPLWDLGLRVGSSVRDVDGALAALRTDASAATALLEGRFVIGDRDLVARLRRAIAADARHWLGPFVAAKVDETRRRHVARGDTPRLNEPHLKEGRGFLRDDQLARVLAALLVLELRASDDDEDDAAAGDRILATLPPPSVEGAVLERDPFVLSGLLRPDEARRTAAAGALLLAARTCLHAVIDDEPSGEGGAAPGAGPAVRDDRLDLLRQREVAARLGYEAGRGRTAAERLMREIYRSATLVDRALELALSAIVVKTAGRPARSRSIHRRVLHGGLVVVGRELFFASGRSGRIPTGGLHAARPAEGTAVGPREGLEAFLAAQRLGLEVSPSALEKIRRGLADLDDGFRHSTRSARAFRQLLSGQTVAATVRAMHRSGFLGEYLPEFGDVDGLVQSDGYHSFSVCEHTLRALEAIEEAPAARESEARTGDAASAAFLGTARPGREDVFRRELFGRITQRDLLRLALLLHDTGKVGGSAGHTVRSVARVGPFARRLHLELDEERRLRFLVEHHTLMSVLATKRDIEAPETSAELSQACAGSADRLDLLYLLTCADIRAAGPGAFPRWKDALVTRLYERTRQEMLAKSAGEPSPRPATLEEVVALLEPLLPAHLSAEDVRNHIVRTKRPYLLETDPEEVLLHVELVAALEARRAAAAEESGDEAPRPALAISWELADGFEHLWVAADDRPALFAALTGALSGAGMDILAARAFTRSDGVAVDRFVVRAHDRAGVADEALWIDLERALTDAIAERIDVDALIDAQARRVDPPSGSDDAVVPRPRPRPARVTVRNKASPRYTVCEVSADDRVGLLYDLARALARLDLDIHTARIATGTHRAEDVFYVTRDGRKVTGERELRELRERLEAAAGGRASGALAD